MRIGLLLNYSSDFATQAHEAVAARSAGVSLIAVPEAYAFDAPSQLGYLAAIAPGMDLTTSVLPIYTRTPALLAMTAATVNHLSDGHFSLGLGASGPQVIEGLHGVRYQSPLARTREVVDICRALWTGRDVAGTHRHVPVRPHIDTDPTCGADASLASNHPPQRTPIPILIAALGLRNVTLTAEIADGWQPMFFAPERYNDVWGDALAAGTARRDPRLRPLDIHAQVPLARGGPGDPGYEAIKGHYALYIGGMGAPEVNFYHRIACRYGFAAAAADIQSAYLAGDKAAAAQAVPDELIAMTALVGDPADMRAQMRAFVRAGVGTCYLIPFDESPEIRRSAIEIACDAAANATDDRSEQVVGVS